MNIFNIKLSTELYFKKRLFNLKVKTAYIKILGIFDSFKLKLEVESGKFQE